LPRTVAPFGLGRVPIRRIGLKTFVDFVTHTKPPWNQTRPCATRVQAIA
jgi:hypothetical protein